MPVAKLAICCQMGHGLRMTSMNISLPDDMKAFVDQQVQTRGYMFFSEYIRDLVWKAKETDDFRKIIKDGTDSETPNESYEDWMKSLHAKVGKSQ